MKAIILAAGRGSRMKKMTENRPKCLVELRGKKLIDWQLEALRNAGLTQVGIVTGYKREMLSNIGLTEFHNPKWADTQMVASLACAQEWLENETCIVSYSDIFYDVSAIVSLIECQADIAITYDQNWRGLWERRFGNPLLDAETFKVDSNHILKEIGNNPKSVEDIQGQYMGLLRFTPRGWAEILRIRASLKEDEAKRMHMTGTLQRVIDADRVQVHALPYTADWGEVDSISDLEKYI